MKIRAPIVSVLGHVDHGKSSILDSLRGSNITGGEAGGITQAIGASIMPIETINERCGELIKQLKMNITIPGVLFIDTPGHAAFTSLRKRGGNLADIAVVTVDINEGFKPQTLEAIEILRNYKTPFVIAANKIDLMKGYKIIGKNFLQSLARQDESTKTLIDQKIYELVGNLHEKFKLESERYDRVSDYTNQIAIIPCSATEALGVEELLMVITGLAQKYLEKNLKLDVDGPGRGVVLEVKETMGMGKTLDVILYDGFLEIGDKVVIGGLNGPVIGKVKSLMMPQPLRDMRDKKSKYKSVKKVSAATGVKICLSNFDESIVSGMPIYQANNNEENIKKAIQDQIESVRIDTDADGVIVKADTIGSLEALVTLLKEHDIPIRKASIGNITKKDISDAESKHDVDPLHSVILGFNIKEIDNAGPAKIIVKDIIYALIDDYLEWQTEVKKRIEFSKLDKINRPGKVEILQSCIFRQSNPCIAGVEVSEGIVKPGTPMMNIKGDKLTSIKSIQAEGESVSKLEKKQQGAIQLPGITAGRHVNEHDFLYVDITENDFRVLKKLKEYLTGDEITLLKEIITLKRKQNPLWGV